MTTIRKYEKEISIGSEFVRAYLTEVENESGKGYVCDRIVPSDLLDDTEYPIREDGSLIRAGEPARVAASEEEAVQFLIEEKGSSCALIERFCVLIRVVDRLIKGAECVAENLGKRDEYFAIDDLVKDCRAAAKTVKELKGFESETDESEK